MTGLFKSLMLVALAAAAGPSWAALSAVVAIEPTQRKDGLMLSRASLQSELGKLTGQSVAVTATEDLTDVMRATRSGGYDIFIAPAQVAASAVSHGYELVGSTDASEQYMLVGKPTIGQELPLEHIRIYLPQQDSIYTYLARGMLTANGLSFADLRKVEYARYPQAGLTAMSLGMTDATVIRAADWNEWSKLNPGAGKIIATSGLVPGGFSVVVRKDLPAEVRAKVAQWFETSADNCGMKTVSVQPVMAQYKAVAALGTFTPTTLPGAHVVNSDQVAQLIGLGAVMVDTRIVDEYNQKHIPQALSVPYGEKSLKDVAYDVSLDRFPGLAKLDPNKPTIFQCNGPECWKSYKASRAAIAHGFRQVYWFRGGMPEWEDSGKPVIKG